MPFRRVIVAVAVTIAAALTAYLCHWWGKTPPVIEPMDTKTAQSPPRPILATQTTKPVSADKTNTCALPEPSLQQKDMAEDLLRLQDYLLQQLKDRVPYPELRSMLMGTPYQSALTLAAERFASSQHQSLLKLADHGSELQQLEQQLNSPDRLQAIHRIKHSALFNARWQNEDGSLSEFSLKSMLLTAAEDDPSLLKIALEDVSISPDHYTNALYHMRAETLEQLLRNSQGLTTYQRDGMNLADFAVLFLRADLLPLLEKFQLKPSLQPGLYSALDLAFTAPEWPARIIGQKAAGDRGKTIEYLQRKGYPLHGKLSVDAEGRPYLMIDSVWNFARTKNGHLYQPQLVELAAAQQLEQIQPVQPSAALQQMLQPLAAIAQEHSRRSESCAQQKQLELQAEGLWSAAQILQEVNRVEQTSADLSVAAAILHQRDPALVTRLWPRTIDIEPPELTAENQAEAVSQLQTNHDPVLATIALSHLQQQPALAVYWQPKAVLHLNSLQKQNDTTAFWRELLKHGFSLQLQDVHGRNLYPQAFAAGADAVALLLTEGVAVDVPAVGPDALDLALDRSYRDKKLHPAVVTIMQKMGKPEASHFSRLRRLQQYQPIVFTALQQALAKEPMLLAWLDDLTRYEANPVLAVADD